MDRTCIQPFATGRRLRALDDLDGLLAHGPPCSLDDGGPGAAEQRELRIGGRAEDVGRGLGQLPDEERDLCAAGDGPALRWLLSRAAPEPVVTHDGPAYS